MDKITKEQISEIAEMIDNSHLCYLNFDTGEYIFMLNSDSLADYGIYWDEEDEDEKPNDNWHDWQKEMYADVKADMEKIDSWENVIEIEKPDSHKGFEFMERFVDEVIPEGKLKERFYNALSRKHPFRNFNEIVHNCKYREDWFKFKQEALEEYVREEINRYERRINSELFPTFFGGIYDDDGNQIDVLNVPVPDLCLTCESFLDDDWDENILCHLTRADKREEGEEFKCYAWRRRKGCEE